MPKLHLGVERLLHIRETDRRSRSPGCGGLIAQRAQRLHARRVDGLDGADETEVRVQGREERRLGFWGGWVRKSGEPEEVVQARGCYCVAFRRRSFRIPLFGAGWGGIVAEKRGDGPGGFRENIARRLGEYPGAG